MLNRGRQARPAVPRRRVHLGPDVAPRAVHRRRAGVDPFMLHIYDALAEQERRDTKYRYRDAKLRAPAWG